VFPLSGTLDHVGPIAASVEDCAYLLSAIAGPEPRAPAPTPDYVRALTGEMRGARIGIPRAWHEEGRPGEETRAAIQRAAELLSGLGAEVGEVKLSPLEAYHGCGIIIMQWEASRIYGDALAHEPHSFGEIFRHRVLLGGFVSEAEYRNALALRERLTREIDQALQSYDAILTVTVTNPAPLIREVEKFYPMTLPAYMLAANLSG